MYDMSGAFTAAFIVLILIGIAIGGILFCGIPALFHFLIAHVRWV